jgi:hypothetical protein
LTKVCKDCLKEKRLVDFSRDRNVKKDGRKACCKACERIRKAAYTYGLSKEDYNNLFQKQKGCCAICGIHQSESKHRLHIDHDHNTGKVRGLLCGNCNTGIGNLRDSIDLLKKAIGYLENT